MLSSYLTLNNNPELKMPMKGIGTYQVDNIQDTITKAIDIGYRMIDTASLYGNEEKIGETLQTLYSRNKIRREELFITTKIWNDEKEDVEKALRNSLARLQTDYVDLYLIHWPMGYWDSENRLVLKPLYKTWQEMEECVRKGLCRAIGVSNFNVQLLLDLLSYAEIKPAVNQIEYHPYLSQQELVKFCQSMGIQIVGYRPFCQQRVDVVNEPILKAIGEKVNRPTTQVILKWITSQNIAVIPKSQNYDRMKLNFEFEDIPLTEDDIQAINTLDCGNRMSVRATKVQFRIPLFD
jgi:diketogulonate reductase-like aldo/keto reductase